MKMRLAATVTTALMILPLSGAPALAGPGDDYPGEVKTSTSSSSPEKAQRGKNVKVTAAMRVDGDGDICQGTFVITAVHRGTGAEQVRKSPSVSSRTFSFRFGRVGVWRIKVRFVPADNSPCKGSKGYSSTRVTRG